VQYENWLWGEQKQMFLPITLFTGMLALTYSQRPFWLKVGLCILMWWLSLGCFAASFFFWPLVLFVQLMQPKVTRQMRLITTLVWILALWIGVKAYFHNFQRPGDTAPELVLLLPEAAFRHFTGFFGAPFRGSYLPWGIIFAAGCISLFINLLPLVKMRRKQRELWRMLPWAAIAIMPVLAGASTTLNRLQLGWWQSQASRYTTFSLLLPLAGVVLWTITFTQWRPLTRRAIVFIGVVGICFYLTTVAAEINAMRITWIKRSAAKQALQWINIDPENPILGELHPDRALLWRVANVYSKLGILPPMKERPQRLPPTTSEVP
jgi:hypothetical protein